MEIIHNFYCEMLYATFKDASERTNEKKEMEDGGWIVYKEYLDHEQNKVVVVFMRDLPEEE